MFEGSIFKLYSLWCSLTSMLDIFGLMLVEINGYFFRLTNNGGDNGSRIKHRYVGVGIIFFVRNLCFKKSHDN